MRNIFLWLVLVSASINSVYAQNREFKIRGKLVESGTSVPIDYAEVRLFKQPENKYIKQVLPQTDGTFVIETSQKGNYSLVIHLIGYDLLNCPDITLENTAEINLGILKMVPLENGIAEVTVVAHRKQVVYKLDKRVINAAANIGTAGGSAVDILENTPAIRVDAEGEVLFRGSSGFTVYIDGKPSVFSGSQALEQIPASHIENIEIITTPSARHDAKGDVGIINIITKKQAQQGLSGIVNLTGSSVLSRGIDFLLTQQNSGSRWYMGGVWKDILRKSDFEQEKTTIVDNQTTTSYSKGPRKSNNNNYALKGGWSHGWKQSMIGLDLEGGYGGRSRNGELDYNETRSLRGIVAERGDYVSRDDYDLHETYGHGTLSAEHRFNDKGHQITGSFYLKYGGDALEYFQSDLFNKQGERQQGHRAWESEHRWTVRGNLDYVLPYSKTGKLEAGYQYYSYLEDGDYKMQFWNPEQGDFYWRDDIYNTFFFKEEVNSIYAILGESWKQFEAQVGVRAEQTHTELRSSKPGADRTKDRFEFFPSAHVGYTLAGNNRFIAAYSRRTTRPQLFYMEPYITYRDYYTAEIGNPDIRPEYINVYEFTYKRDMGANSLTATLFHRSRTDKIERLRVPFTAGVTLDSMANVGRDYSTGLELSGSVQINKVWSSNLNGNLYHYKVKNEREAGGKQESSTNYDIMWNNTIDLAKYTRLQVDGNFVGPSVTTQGSTRAFWYVNLAVRQQMFNRKLTGTLAFRDLFGSARYTSRIMADNLKSVTHIQPVYPLLTLTLSYTFNSYKAKSSQTRENHDLFEGTNH